MSLPMDGFIHTHKASTMKLFLAILFAAVWTNCHAQETLFDDMESGGFGGPYIQLTSVHGSMAYMVGGRGGWVVNHALIIGGGGIGLSSRITARTIGPDTSIDVSFSYGGLFLDYMFMSNKVVHPSVSLLIGGGSASTNRRPWRDSMSMHGNESYNGIFVLEPAVHIELNVFKHFRLMAGVAYRYVTGVTGQESSNADFSGVSGVLTFKFGTF